MNYFKNCETIEQVKHLYRTLAKDNHPDRGGDTATMQAINKEYSFIMAKIASGQGWTAEEVNSAINFGELYKDAINAVINLEGITIELVGSWIWVTGNTRQHKDVLRSAGYWFASKKVAWYFRGVEFKTKGGKKTLDEIKAKYGSENIKTTYRPAQAIR